MNIEACPINEEELMQAILMELLGIEIQPKVITITNLGQLRTIYLTLLMRSNFFILSPGTGERALWIVQ